ncbi:hypothetical protein [Herbaspirillum sp. RV1423]|uniref:hypothetical protein n=1 Tax=Herbaspirillum sp. RV1423 TaxID=1443993 RepID=UPI0006872C1C|nr:hypothetical protein [Herbaspirillum sp. RV1423]
MRSPYFLLVFVLMQISAAYAAPVEVVSGQTTYISGGIGSDEAAEMKSMASRYVLEVVSVVKADPREQYTADYRILIKDATGKTVLDAVSEGPFFLANLPDGNYQVEATQDGVRKSQRTSVKKGAHRRLVFVWPQ